MLADFWSGRQDGDSAGRESRDEVVRLPVPVGKNLPEKRSTTLDLGDARTGRIIEIIGEPSSAGQPVNEKTSLGVGAVVACVQILATQIAKIPIYLYRDTRRGPKEIEAHPIVSMLREPGDLHTGFELRSLMQVGIGLGGNGFARVYRDRFFQPQEIEWLAPSDVEAKLIRRSDGRRLPQYEVKGLSGTYDRTDILHVRSPICLDGLHGMSPIRMLRESLGTSLAQTKAAGVLMKNGAKWPAALVFDGVMKKETLDDARDEVNRNVAGAMNAGRIPVIGGGAKMIQMNGMSFVDAQFVESRKMELHEVARHYGVPAFMVDSTATSTWGSGIAQQVRGFLNLSLDAWLANWEASLRFTLLTTEEKAKGYYFKFDRDQIANIDPKERAEFHQIMRNIGVFSANDVRRKEGEPLIPAEEGGDDYGRPFNASGGTPKAEKPPADPAPTTEPTPAP